MGIHGEPGVRRGPLETADEIADELLGAILADLRLGRGDRVAVLVNGLGATPLEELYILYRRVHAGSDRARRGGPPAVIGEFATSLEMAGASLTAAARSTTGSPAGSTRRPARRSTGRDRAVAMTGDELRLLLIGALPRVAEAVTSCATSTRRSATATSA